MSITLTCSCGRGLRIRDEQAGKRVRCPACGDVLATPVPSPGVATPIATPSGLPPRPKAGRYSERIRKLLFGPRKPLKQGS
jgi:hypothetical protein